MTSPLVTGAAGFIGRNLLLALGRRPGVRPWAVDVDTPEAILERALDSCDVVYHLAGVNRPETEAEYETGNVGSLAGILSGLERRDRRPPIVLSSSAQALLDNPYGRSKAKAERLLIDHARRTGMPARVFRLPGVFGKWGRPDYNSVVATFCHNVARDLPLRIQDPDKEIELIHIDDVVSAFTGLLDGIGSLQGAAFETATPVFRVTIGSLAEKLLSFRASRETLVQPGLEDPFDRRLFGTYMSYLPEKALAYALPRKEDPRGTLAEFLKLDGHGQIFVSRTRPGITRGNHYHDLKVEKFLVLEGDALIRLRHLATGAVTEVPVSGLELKAVDIPPGWTHSIANVGAAEMVVLFWASEVYDGSRPDTYAAEVKE
jgi:UDP-2-acetamido-2,6-beta-L-arabino-hexul-4-ose reductase